MSHPQSTGNHPNYYFLGILPANLIQCSMERLIDFFGGGDSPLLLSSCWMPCYSHLPPRWFLRWPQFLFLEWKTETEDLSMSEVSRAGGSCPGRGRCHGPCGLSRSLVFPQAPRPLPFLTPGGSCCLLLLQPLHLAFTLKRPNLPRASSSRSFHSYDRGRLPVCLRHSNSSSPSLSFFIRSLSSSSITKLL